MQTTSTINPLAPSATSGLSSAVVRNNFAAAYNDINAILQAFSGTMTLGTQLAAPSDAALLINQNTIAATPNGRGANERWPFQIFAADGVPAGFGVDVFAYAAGAAYGNFASNPNPPWAAAFAVWDFRRANGKAASPLPLKGGDLIGVIGSLGYVAAGYGNGGLGYSGGAAQYRTYADGDWTTTNQPARHEWMGTAQGTDAQNNKPYMRLQTGLTLSGSMTVTDTPGANDPGPGVIYPDKGVKGTITNDNAAVGIIGEIVSTAVLQAGPQALTTNTAVNLGTGITLTAGDWDIFAEVNFTTTTTTSLQSLKVYISPTSGAVVASPVGGQYWGTSYPVAGQVQGQAIDISGTVGPFRASLSVSTSYFCVVVGQFNASTLSAWGVFRAVRRR